MKLTSVELHPTNSSEVAVLSFRDPGAKNPYNVKAITGLDADSIIPRHYTGSGSSNFNNMYLEDRDVVIRIGLNPNFSENKTYSDLRDALYKMIASSRTGKLEMQFKNGTHAVAAISGHVSRIESPLFEKTQEVQITIHCDEPLLKAIDPVIIEYTAPAGSTNITIEDKLSTAPHGFYFDLQLLTDMDSFTMEDPNDVDWKFEVTPSGGFLEDDRIIFSSEENNKGIWVIREESTTPIADSILPTSVWPVIFPGVNRFKINTSLVTWLEILYYPTYWGV